MLISHLPYSYRGFTPAFEASDSCLPRLVCRLNILSLLASFAREILVIETFTRKFASWEGLLRLRSLPVITSLLEQAPDWLTRRVFPPKF